MKKRSSVGRRARQVAASGFVVAGLLASMAGNAVPAAASGVTPVAHRHLGVVPSASARAHVKAAAALAAGQPIPYLGGPVQTSHKVYAIFWQPPGYSLPTAFQDGVAQYFTDVAADSFKTSNVSAAMTQYYQVVGGAKQFLSYNSTYVDGVVDTAALPASGCRNYQLGDLTTTRSCLTGVQLQAEISSVVTDLGLPRGVNITYFLFTPARLGSCDPDGSCYNPNSDPSNLGYCGYHSQMDTTPPTVFSFVPWDAIAGCDTPTHPNGNVFDATLNTTSHEQNETITDPLGNAWVDNNDPSGGEVGDKCAGTYGATLGSTASGQYNQVINGDNYYLQEEWSNRVLGCVQTSTFPQPTASISFRSPVHGQPAAFQSRARDRDDTTFTYTWSFGDGKTSALANPSHTYATAGSKTVTLLLIDLHGDQVRVTSVVHVA